MKFKKIFGEVLKGNEGIMRLHNLHGYRSVGVYKDHIFKNNKFHDVLLVELLDEAWFNLQKKYKRYIADFEE
jgi:RimJ/RimL family protein N-acetyltransferase